MDEDFSAGGGGSTSTPKLTSNSTGQPSTSSSAIGIGIRKDQTNAAGKPADAMALKKRASQDFPGAININTNNVGGATANSSNTSTVSPQFLKPSGRKASISNSAMVVGSPKSFQDRLFQKTPSSASVGVGHTAGEEPSAATVDMLLSPHSSITADSRKASVASGIGGEVQQNPHKKAPKPTMTKAERRELQERQRAAKAAGGGGKPPASQQQVSQKMMSIASPPRQGSETNVMLAAANAAAVNAAVTGLRNPAVKKQYKKGASVGGTPDPNAGKIVGLFSHLPQYNSEYTNAKEKALKGVIHPTVISLGLQYAENIITGGNARCLALLIALTRVIQDYTPPSGTSLQRNLTQHISKQVDFLSNTRSLAESMKTAIRYVKEQISALDFTLPDEDAKKMLVGSINDFMRMRIELAHISIIDNLLNGKKIKSGDVILTSARSSIVMKALLEAHAKNIDFRVIVVDSRPKLEGKETLAELQRYNIPCSYVMSTGVHFVMKEATKVLLGASAVFANGDIMSRVGTSIVAMSAYDNNVPVMVLCEFYKFSEKVRLDSFVWNELGNPEDLIDVSNRPPSSHLPPSLLCSDLKAALPKQGDLSSWREIENLKLLNLTYDITPAKFINLICCESGFFPSSLTQSVARLQSAS